MGVKEKFFCGASGWVWVVEKMDICVVRSGYAALDFHVCRGMEILGGGVKVCLAGRYRGSFFVLKALRSAGRFFSLYVEKYHV